jgi:hypothetical protein
MRVGGAGQGGVGLVPYGTGGTTDRRREAVEALGATAGARPDITAPFATTRHPYVRIEAMRPAGSGRGPTGFARTDFSRAGDGPAGPSVAFLAQYIAQTNLREGLELDKAADGTRAYRRAEIPAVQVRTGANVDVAA